jgi:hypothetical protein
MARSLDGWIGFTTTIIAGKRAAAAASDCAGEVCSGIYSLIVPPVVVPITGDATGNRTGVHPQCGALQHNGGSTRTRLPVAAR